jgi:hypothetical protein
VRRLLNGEFGDSLDSKWPQSLVSPVSQTGADESHATVFHSNLKDGFRLAASKKPAAHPLNCDSRLAISARDGTDIPQIGEWHPNQRLIECGERSSSKGENRVRKKLLARDQATGMVTYTSCSPKLPSGHPEK